MTLVRVMLCGGRYNALLVADKHRIIAYLLIFDKMVYLPDQKIEASMCQRQLLVACSQLEH